MNKYNYLLRRRSFGVENKFSESLETNVVLTDK